MEVRGGNEETEKKSERDIERGEKERGRDKGKENDMKEK